MKKLSFLSLFFFVFSVIAISQVNFQPEGVNKSKGIKELIENYKTNHFEHFNMHQDNNPEKMKSINSDYGDPPDWAWTSQFGGSGADHIRDITTDAEDNIYITGSFSGDLSIEENSYTSIGNWDAFVAKFQSDGNLEWFKQISSSEQEVIDSYGIHLDNAANIYITGYYTGSVTLGSFNLPNVSNYNLFFAKLDAIGNYLFAANHAGSNNAIGLKIKSDNLNNIYISGSANGSTTYNHPGLVLKFDHLGNEMLFYSSEQTFCDMEVFDENIYFLGRINMPGYLGDFYFEPISYGDVFLAKSDLNLNFEWAHMAGHDANGDSYSTEFYVTENENIYLTGKYRFDIIFGDHELQGSNTFLAKCSSSGEFLWLSEAPFGYSGGNPIGICGNDITSYLAFYQLVQGNRINEILYYDANTGNFGNSEVFDNPIEEIYYSLNNDNITTGNNVDELISVSLLTNSLQSIWEIPFEGNSAHGWIISTATDQYGYIYTYGYASNNLDYFGQSIEKGLFLAKQNHFGGITWIKQFPDSYLYTGSGSYMITDTLSQSVYFTTAFNNDFILSNGTVLEAGTDGSTIIVKYDIDGNFQWVIQENFMGSGLCLSSDYSDNILITGEFLGTINIGNTTLTALGSEDVFIAKYNSDSEFQWAIRAGGQGGHEFVEYISTDSDDNIYLTGEFTCVENTINNYQITLNDGDGNILFAKLDPFGNVIWATSKANSPIPYGDESCWPTGIQTDLDGNSYIKGWHGDSTYFDDILLLTPYGMFGISYFIAKFDPDGNTIWANSINQHRYGFDYNQMDIDPLGNVYMGAQIRDTIHFGDDFTYIPAGNYDLFVAKYLSDGELDWVKTMESGTSECWLSSISVYDEESIYIGGRFNYYLNFGNSTLTSLNKHGFSAFMGEIVGVKNIKKDHYNDLFELFPNPTQFNTNIRLKNSNVSDANVNISDISGKRIFDNDIQFNGMPVKIDLSNYSKGVYLLKVQSEESVEVKRLVVY